MKNYGSLLVILFSFQGQLAHGEIAAHEQSLHYADREISPRPREKSQFDIVTPGMEPISGVEPITVYINGEPNVIMPPSVNDVAAFKIDASDNISSLLTGRLDTPLSPQTIARMLMRKRIEDLSKPHSRSKAFPEIIYADEDRDR